MNSLSSLVLKITKDIENKNDIKNELIVNLVEILIKSEVKPGGPYRTGNKVDPILNANILKLFILLNKPLPNIETYLSEHVELKPGNISPQLKSILNEIYNLRKTQLNKPSSGKSNYEFYNTFLDSLSVEIKDYSKQIGSKILKADEKGEISNLSQCFQDSLTKPTKLTNIELELIGQANFMVWVSYSIYDAIIDNEATPSSLSAANIFLREAFRLYLLANIDIDILFDYTSKVDNANAWETSHCRFTQTSSLVNIISVPEISQMEKLLSNRAIAHVIGPVHIASKSALNHEQFEILNKALSFYCIARQLNDDLHDWVDDFNNGRITFVVASLLHKLGVKSCTKNKKILLNKMKIIFYESELERLCLLTESYITKAINLLVESGLKKTHNSFIDSYLTPIRLSSVKAREIHVSNKLSVLNLNTL